MDEYDEKINTDRFMEDFPDIKDFFVSLKNEKNLLSLYDLTKEESLIKEWFGKNQDVSVFIKDIMFDLSEKINEYDKSMIYYFNKDGEYIFLYNPLSYDVWIKYHGFWDILLSVYELDFDDVKIIIRYILENVYKLKVRLIRQDMDL